MIVHLKKKGNLINLLLKTKLFLLSQITLAIVKDSNISSPSSLSWSCYSKPILSLAIIDNFCTLRLPSCQTAIDEGKLHSIWKVVSVSAEHTGQRGLETTCLLNRLFLVGKRSRLSLQSKLFNTTGAFVFQSHFQNSVISTCLENSPISCPFRCTFRW